MTQLNNLHLGWLEWDNTIILLITISLVILGILFYKLTPSNSSPPLPPGPRSLPIVGYLPFLGPDLPTQLTDMARIYGPIFKFKLGSKLLVVINTPDLAKVVAHDQDQTFANRNVTVAASVITYGGQDIAFSNYNSHWRKLRKIFVHGALSKKNLEACSSFRTDEVRKTIKNIFDKMETLVEIKQVSFMTELDVITSMILGNTSGPGGRHLRVEFQKLIMDINDIFVRTNWTDYFPMLARFDLQGVERDMMKQLKTMDYIIESMIEDRTNSNSSKSDDGLVEGDEGKKDFLQILLDLKNQEDGTSLDIIHIKALLLDVIIGGVETTATLVEWVMARIMQNHDVMKRVQEELTNIVGLNNIVQESHLINLQYLDATIKETLRLHPIGGYIPRSPSKDCIVGGYTIPKNTTVLLNLWSIQRDPRYWDNALEFNPDRFLTCSETNKLYNGNNLTYFPFGSGRRLCPGLPLAEKMTMYILASLLHSFDWRMPKGDYHDFSGKLGITLRKIKPLIAIPSQRLIDTSLYV